MKEEWVTWMKRIYILCTIILLGLGFLAGFLYNYKYFNENSLIYGVKEMNKANNDYFVCSCHSKENFQKSFTFTEEKIDMNEYFVIN